jgi:Carboxypeptidase regulatory-like domain
MQRYHLLFTFAPILALTISSKSMAQSITTLSPQVETDSNFKKIDNSQNFSLPVTNTSSNANISIPESNSPKPAPDSTDIALAKFGVFPVGLNVSDTYGGELRTLNPGLLIRGKEDGKQAIDFENWLVPYDAVIEALKFRVTTLADGGIELRSPGIVTRIDLKKLRSDSELGLVFSIKELETLFGVKARFDIEKYAIVLDVPWLDRPESNSSDENAPVVVEGLPRISPGKFNISALEQRVNASGSQNFTPSYSGDLQAVGSAFDGSWYLRTSQANFRDARTWNIAEAQFLRQTDKTDYFVGSQPSFWQSQSNGDYWGFTRIQRQGFTPPENSSAGASDPRQRLEAASVGKTVTGEAIPGTLVRLVQGFGDKILGEMLVDSSGVYRFENIKTTSGGNVPYRIFLYPQGRLTATPTIREATFSAAPGQIPVGSSALVVSGGLGRKFSRNDQLLGNFSDFRGGIAGRWGVSENLTLGFGGVYDESLKGLGELFWQPNGVPLRVAVSALAGNRVDFNADVRYTPSQNFSATFSSDRLSSRLSADWRILPNISLFTGFDSRTATFGGIQFNHSSGRYFGFGRASLDTENRFRWYLLQGFGAMLLQMQGNEIGSFSELSYNLSGRSAYSAGHSLLLGYDTRVTNQDDLLTMGWRYRSNQRAIDGNYLLEMNLGYAMGNRGNGLVGSIGTTVLPGVMLRGRYQGISLTSNESSFNLELVSSATLQGGLSAGDRRSQYFRTQGGLMVQAFFDKNNNGKLDSGEDVYTENTDLLVLLNNRSIKQWQPDTKRDRVNVRLKPGTYRLDIDPAGLPLDWQASTDATAVDVAAGSYTRVFIPLVRSYVVSGVITNAEGVPISGARVEAISPDTKSRKFSVTNGAGVYYLEGLQQGNYSLSINGKSVSSYIIKLDNLSQGLQEVNLKQLQNQDFQAISLTTNESALKAVSQSSEIQPHPR